MTVKSFASLYCIYSCCSRGEGNVRPGCLFKTKRNGTCYQFQITGVPAPPSAGGQSSCPGRRQSCTNSMPSTELHPAVHIYKNNKANLLPGHRHHNALLHSKQRNTMKVDMHHKTCSWGSLLCNFRPVTQTEEGKTVTSQLKSSDHSTIFMSDRVN